MVMESKDFGNKKSRKTTDSIGETMMGLDEDMTQFGKLSDDEGSDDYRHGQSISNKEEAKEMLS